VHLQSWPQLDPAALVVSEITLVVQVNGKVRGNMQVPADADRQALIEYAKGCEAAQKY
jgi:leucyl-tRNA synthetase